MDIFVRHVPQLATTRQLRDAFKGPLAKFGIDVYHPEKWRNRDIAVLTILDADSGYRFLREYGVPQGSGRHVLAPKAIFVGDGRVQCMKDRNEPSDFALSLLAYEASQRAPRAAPIAVAQRAGQSTTPKTFNITGLQCGVWDYVGNQFAFTPHYSKVANGRIAVGYRGAIIVLGLSGSHQLRVDLSYFNCENIVLGEYGDANITFSLKFAPKFYSNSNEDGLSSQLAAMGLLNRPVEITAKKMRLPSLDDSHADISGVCFVYRITLCDWSQISSVLGLLRRNRRMPTILSKTTPTIQPVESWCESKKGLDRELTASHRSDRKPFALVFQMDRLARNGMLQPGQVLALLDKVDKLNEIFGLNAILSALQRFYWEVPYAGPGVEAARLSVGSLEAMLQEYAESYDQHAPNNPYVLAKRHAHINLIHRLIITPSSIRLDGPEPEPTNRVLRSFLGQTDSFVRVVFQDEDGSTVRYDPRASQELIYHQRFKRVLDGAVNIAGHDYKFLGFSHSSLRTQSCWFMAPLVRPDGTPVNARDVLEFMGDFAKIRVPAKCAARIGQTFTDTVTSVKVEPDNIAWLPIVERNGRDFSDGCGTISPALLEEVCSVYGSRRLMKPTVLQIRFQGVKGVVSLDSRLHGRQLCLRSNMKKFESINNWDLEICGANFRPLNMTLNRQLIKILEDLQVSMDVFMQLQKEAVDKLRGMTTSAVNSATLLESIEGTKATEVPALIKVLDEIGVNYQEDSFLYKVVEMAVVSKLRELKYRARIPVEQGVTLFGIMDETGYLQEGQVYVATESGPGGGRDDRARSKIIITRSPAMHPGDIQLVDAVDVPADSPLKHLSNVVVFSQHGDRDLPSQLSGGDLDGDLFNVIWDQRLTPGKTETPADYPRVAPIELNRDVTAKDMSDFFVTFMETDQLGVLCNLHLELADWLSEGTLSPECLTLAGMASTAVDYSKTGIAVDMKRKPKPTPGHCRPDFMSPSPRMVVSPRGPIELENDADDNDEAFEGLDSELSPYRYYESKKTLGHLYRAIDEHKFIEDIEHFHLLAVATSASSTSLLDRILSYVQQMVTPNGILYLHHEQLAREIRAEYEDNLIDIMHLFEPSPRSPLSEHEVFAGQILGRQAGAQGKSLRELGRKMREHFGAVVDYTVKMMIHGTQAVQAAEDLDDLYDYDEREVEALPRALACLTVAVEEPGQRVRRRGELKSFGYVAAGVVLRELQRYRITTFRSYTLPKLQ